VVEDRFRQVFRRNRNLFATFQIGHLAAGHRLGHGLADLPLEAAQETLPVDGAAILAGQAAVDELAHGVSRSMGELTVIPANAGIQTRRASITGFPPARE
jgi:hypothetical protein